MSGDPGTCAFCGWGDGHLGETGDETTQYLHGAVRTGKPGDWEYGPHPEGHGHADQAVTWCGHCVGGLAHKYQRYDDVNLHAALVAAKARLELDGLRWTVHFAPEEECEKLAAAGHVQDDPAIHLDKLRLERDAQDMQNEKFRRAGFDLTTRGWRP